MAAHVAFYKVYYLAKSPVQSLLPGEILKPPIGRPCVAFGFEDDEILVMRVMEEQSRLVLTITYRTDDPST